MKYYLIAGEASGDLHASHLMRSLQREDPSAEFRFIGGDLMAEVGGTCVRHYRSLAYMGFLPVLLHLPTILSNMRMAKRDILEWQPACVILIDYPGFNLDIATFVKRHSRIPVFYYIAPKLWAWKEYRITTIKRSVDALFSILPFEVDFFERKHHYPIHYVGNPTASEVSAFRAQHPSLSRQPIIALLCGSRRQEISSNLPAMLQAVAPFANSYRIVVAGAPGIPSSYYQQFLAGRQVEIVHSQTYTLLSTAHAALVTSGTATLETALFGVPQVVCYSTPLPWLLGRLRKLVLKVQYISLVNLIAGREVVAELVADTFTIQNMQRELCRILDGDARSQMLSDYAELHRILGDTCAPDNAARIMYKQLKNNK